MNPIKARYFDGCGVASKGGQQYYEYPKDHPCHGCPYKFPVSKPSCTMGSRPPDCAWYFYKKIISRRKQLENEE